jgi:hypothetical protein
MKRISVLVATMLLLSFAVSAQGTNKMIKKPPLKGTYLKAGKLYIAKGYKGERSPEGRVVIMKMAANGGSAGISGTYICQCKSVSTGGSDDCKTLVSGDMLDCFSKDGKCDQCMLLVSTDKSIALKDGKNIEWAILDTQQ